MVDHTSEKLKHVVIGSAVAVLALTVIAGSLLGGLTSEGVEITNANIKLGSNSAVLIVAVKNTGDSSVTDLKIFSSTLNSTDADISTALHGSGVAMKSETVTVGDSTSHTIQLERDELKPGDSFPVTVEGFC